MTDVATLLDEALDLGLVGEQRWFRGDIARGIELRQGKPGVDRQGGAIFGYAVATKGPAIGHDMQLDETTIEQIVSLGNQSRAGIKTRFDHPNASNTSMGTFLGRSRNFRREGDRVLADLHLSESAKEAPQGDLYSYVLGLAERDPEAFGASIVFEGKAEHQLNPDGTRKKDAQGNPLPRLARIEKLLASDVVDDPAANPGGLFHQGADGLASKLTSFLNRWAEHNLLPKLSALRAGHQEGAMSEAILSETTITSAQLDAARITCHAAGRKEGIEAERARVAAIHVAFTAVWGAQATDAERTMRDGLIELGTSAVDAERMFKERKLAQLTAAAPQSAGGGADTQTTKAVDRSAMPLEDRCKAEWEANEQGVREEFGSLSAYVAFARAEAAGQIKILKK